MAYGVDKIQKIEAWTCASEFADDGSLDVDDTTCMTNGTNGEDCDEIKEGTLNLRIEIAAAPAAITSLSIRFYLNSIMTAGNNSVVPYTDANSVSGTNANEQDYSTAGQWVEHVISGAALAELGDLGGYCALRFASEGGAKSKIGEVNIDIAVTQETVAGVSRDSEGATLGSCKVALFRITSEGPPETYEFVEAATSNGSGVWSFSVDANSDKFMVYWEKDDSPHVMDASDNVLVSS